MTVSRYAHVFHSNDDDYGRNLARAVDEAGYLVLTEQVELAAPEVVIDRQSYRGEEWMQQLVAMAEEDVPGDELYGFIEDSL